MSRATACAGSSSSSRSARSSAWPSTTSRCCAPSCRSRPIRRRSSSAAWTARAREAATSSARACSARSWRRRSSSAAARAANTRSACSSLGAGSSVARGDHAHVADRAAVGAAQRDRQVAVELVGAQEAVRRVAQPRAAADEQQVVLVGVLAGRAGERELVALAQLHARRQALAIVTRVARALLDQLGDEGDLGVERAGELGDEAAQERRADDARGPGGEAGEEVTLAGDLGGGGGHGNPAMLTRLQRPDSGAGTPPGTVTSRHGRLTPPFVRGHDHALGEAGPVLVLFGDYEDPDSAAAHRAVIGAARALGRLHLRLAAPADRRAAPERQRRRAGRRGRRRAGRVLGLSPRPARASGCALGARPLELCGADRAGGVDADGGHAGGPPRRARARRRAQRR